MRLLLDTNSFIQWHAGKLRPAAVRTVQRAELVVVSAVSAWEIAVKRALGKLDLKDTVEQIVARYGFLRLPAQDPARQIRDARESCVGQMRRGRPAATAAFAVDDNLPLTIERVDDIW